MLPCRLSLRGHHLDWSPLLEVELEINHTIRFGERYHVTIIMSLVKEVIKGRGESGTGGMGRKENN